jgi:hypothetical protein
MENKMINKIVSYSTIIFLTGCATISHGPNQNVTVITTQNDFYESTLCTLNNEEGTWTVKPDAISEVHRDGNEMDVTCKNEQQIGKSLVKPDFGASFIFLNILIDYCTISCLIDAGTNAFYGYPTLISVPMKQNVLSRNKQL